MAGKRTKQVTSALAAGAVWVLVFPVAVEEGTEAWLRWLGILDIQSVVDAVNILYQQYGPWSMLLAVAVSFVWWFYWYPPIWFRRCWPRLVHGSHSMSGIPELVRCQQALIKYMAIPRERPISSAEIAGSVELYPYMTDLCRILDEQGIPHPQIDYGLTIVDTRKWSKFLGDLWAVRHDTAKARCVHRDGQEHRL